jgi:tetratricopeptide (TPR) repeat protein
MAVPDLQDAIDHLQKQDVDGAIATLERKIDELPAHLTAHVLLARAHEAKQQWKQALTCWENVYFLIPNSPVAREGKRRVLRKMDRGEEADDIDEVAPPVPGAPAASASESGAAGSEEAEPADEVSEADTSEAPLPPGAGTDDARADDERETAEDILSPDDEGPTTAPEAVSELEKLRQQAEEEARRGGARAGLSTQGPPSVGGDEASPDEQEADGDNADDDLDQLIDELESARIEPSPDMDDVPAPDLEHDVDDLVSETLARIHEAQEDYRRAAQIYVKLASQDPDQARAYLEKAAEMRRKAEQQPDEDEQ